MPRLTSDYTVSGYLHGERITGFVQDITPFARISSTSDDEHISRGRARHVEPHVSPVFAGEPGLMPNKWLTALV
jgi:hypothetical protein